jgi:hypothetical protein
MITSQPSMSGLQSSIGSNPTANLGSGFLPSSSTPIGSMVISSTCYPFGWNWNSGVSVPTINLIRSVTPPSILPYPRVSHVPSSLPFLGGTNPFGSYPFPRGGDASSGQHFPANVNIPRIYHFLGSTYSPSNVWKQGCNYFHGGSSYQVGNSYTPNSYMGGPYGPSGLNMPLPLG